MDTLFVIAIFLACISGLVARYAWDKCECPHCKGSGEFASDHREGVFNIHVCPHCKGSGKLT